MIPCVMLNQHEQACCSKARVQSGLTRFAFSKEALQPSMGDNATYLVVVPLVATKSQCVRVGGATFFAM